MANRSNSSLVIALRAQYHRAAPTESERVLWSHIKACQLGVWFRRQVPIGNFIVDFLAPSVGLVVEVDGNCHRMRRHADARRDVKLARLGYRVLRLESNLVLRHMEVAIERLRAALGQGQAIAPPEPGSKFLKRLKQPWRLVEEQYDDGGFTGANTDRPAFQRLMADVQAGRIDVIVVYKVIACRVRFSTSLRLQRSLAVLGRRRPS